jgi:hypothetical protein
MLNFEKASKILEDHFANLTDEEFITNLKEYCPRVFDKNDKLDEADLAKHLNGTKEVTNGSISDLKKLAWISYIR